MLDLHRELMAWRIDESVIRGEIDNRTRGRVCGRIWFVGRAEPVELDLAGNAWRDLAGRKLDFVNSSPKPGNLEGVATRQSGVIGDCTASRKVRVPEIPMDQIGEYYLAKKPFPWHWGNSLYLEWFSTPNGRVVIESAGFELTITPEIAWEMSEAEEELQRRANAEAVGDFLARCVDAVASERRKTDPPRSPDPAVAWSAEKPFSEAEAEKMQEDSDRLMDRIQARMDREGPAADFATILDEEMERRARERGEEPLTPEEESARDEWVAEMNRAAEEALLHPDPEVEAEMAIEHPLVRRATDLAMHLRKESEDRDWIPTDAQPEHPVVEMMNGVMSAAARLAGALNGVTWPPSVDFCASHIVRLKRARGYLADASLAAKACAEEKLIDIELLVGVQREIDAIAREAYTLVGKLRAKLERGFD